VRTGSSGRWLAAPAAVALVVLALWAAGGKAPHLPADGDHGLDQAEARCLTCHGRGGRNPRPADHPQRDDCFSCHRDAAGELHPRPGAPTAVPGGWRDAPRLEGKVRP